MWDLVEEVGLCGEGSVQYILFVSWLQFLLSPLLPDSLWWTQPHVSTCQEQELVSPPGWTVAPKQPKQNLPPNSFRQVFCLNNRKVTGTEGSWGQSTEMYMKWGR